jgi:hypothetical protein
MEDDLCGGAAGIGGGGPAVQFLVERSEAGEPLTPCPYFHHVSGPDDTLRGHWAGTIRFVNMTPSPVQFYWIHYEVERQPSELVPAWSDWCCGGTSQYDVFVATDADTGECLGLFEMVPGDNRVLLAE